jgi:hypothetical protein
MTVRCSAIPPLSRPRWYRCPTSSSQSPHFHSGPLTAVFDLYLYRQHWGRHRHPAASLQSPHVHMSHPNNSARSPFPPAALGSAPASSSPLTAASYPTLAAVSSSWVQIPISSCSLPIAGAEDIVIYRSNISVRPCQKCPEQNSCSELPRLRELDWNLRDIYLL